MPDFCFFENFSKGLVLCACGSVTLFLLTCTSLAIFVDFILFKILIT